MPFMVRFITNATDFINALPGNGSIDTRNNGNFISVDECYNSFLGSSQRANELAG
jgi:hypothetical protein